MPDPLITDYISISGLQLTQLTRLRVMATILPMYVRELCV